MPIFDLGDAPLSPGYLAAIEAHNAAQRVFAPIVASYRAGTIGDSRYLEGRALMRAADACFDIAFEREQRGERAPVLSTAAAMPVQFTFDLGD